MKPVFREIIKDIPHIRLAEMWCELNTFNIPVELSSAIQPEEATYNNSHRIGEAMSEIVKIVGQEFCLKEWRRTRLTEKGQKRFN